jgi:hypothetical protein
MILPTVHINGTNCNELVRQQLAVVNAGRQLLAALREATPNGRDYYPQGPQALGEAQEQHAARLAFINDLVEQCQDVAVVIMKQGKGKL